MFDRYIDYNKVAEEMIRNHEDNVAALESLREQYDELMADDGLKGVQYDKVHVQANRVDDAIVNGIIRRESLLEQIESLEKENALFYKSWTRLAEEERQILEAFFLQGLRSEEAAVIIMESLHCERATVFRKRTKAVQRFKRLLFG